MVETLDAFEGSKFLQAHRYREMVMQGNGRSMTELAAEAGVGGSYYQPHPASRLLGAGHRRGHPRRRAPAGVDRRQAHRRRGTIGRPGSGSIDHPACSGPNPARGRPTGWQSLAQRTGDARIARRRHCSLGTVKSPDRDFRARGRCFVSPGRSLLPATGAIQASDATISRPRSSSSKPTLETA